VINQVIDRRYDQIGYKEGKEACNKYKEAQRVIEVRQQQERILAALEEDNTLVEDNISEEDNIPPSTSPRQALARVETDD
jgi:hypothetical protein